MNHQEARLLIGGDPGTVPPELAEHLANCPECARFQREMVALDMNIRRALEQPPTASVSDSGATVAAGPEPADAVSPPAAVPNSVASPPGVPAPVVPPPVTRPAVKVLPADVTQPIPVSAKVIPIAGARTGRNKPASTWSGWALAASILVASVATLAIWALHPTDTLAHDVVRHLEHEPKSWSSTQPVSTEALNEILHKAGVTLDANSDKVMYARTCPFRGHEVPHLVVSTPHGNVTVLVLRYENVKSRQSFHDDGMTGVITPAPHGSIAVLAQGNDNIDAVAAQVQQSVRWLPESN
jgi:hypothetical protein